MGRIRRRAAYYLLFIAGLIAVASVTYDLGMRTFEPGPYPPPGTEVSLLHSAQVVVETFTATGYGSDAPWASAEMNALVMLLDVTGVGLFFLALPAILLPLFEEALSPSPPTELDAEVADHVVVCSNTARADALLEELESNGIEGVFVTPDRERAISLEEDGYRVVHGDPESTADLEEANVAAARAVVADVSDRVDASIVLAAKEAAEDVPVVSVVEETEVAAYHELAGADHVLTPRRALGEALAGKLTTGLDTDAGDAVRLGESFEVAEIPVRRDSRLAGRTIAETDLREEYGVNVIGGWLRGDFEAPPDPAEPLASGTVLLVAGSADGIDRLRAAELSSIRYRGSERGHTIVAGYGEVGRTVTEALSSADVPNTTVDETPGEGVDVVGDVTDPETLRAADIEAASAVVFALPDDTVTEFATLVVRDLDPSVEIIARAERSDAVRKAYRAGADYVLSLATVSGRSIASRIVDGEEILSVETNVEIVRTEAPGLDGRTIEGAAVRERTGCTIVAIERDGSVRTDLDGEFRIEAGDELVVAGTDSGTNRFLERYA